MKRFQSDTAWFCTWLGMALLGGSVLVVPEHVFGASDEFCGDYCWKKCQAYGDCYSNCRMDCGMSECSSCENFKSWNQERYNSRTIDCNAAATGGEIQKRTDRCVCASCGQTSKMPCPRTSETCGWFIIAHKQCTDFRCRCVQTENRVADGVYYICTCGAFVIG